MALIAPPTSRITSNGLNPAIASITIPNPTKTGPTIASRHSPKLAGEPPDESALHGCDDDAEVGVIQTHLPFAEMKGPRIAQKQRDHALQHDERRHADERDQQKLHEEPMAQDRLESAGMQPSDGIRRFMHAAFLQSQRSLHHGNETHRGGEITR